MSSMIGLILRLSSTPSMSRRTALFPQAISNPTPLGLTWS